MVDLVNKQLTKKIMKFTRGLLKIYNSLKDYHDILHMTCDETFTL
jgi:hypothetical protein